MEKYHYKLAAVLLEMASDYFSNRSCNDFNLEDFIESSEDRDKLLTEFNISNARRTDIDLFDDDWVSHPGNDGWMGFLAKKFKQAAEGEN